MMTDYEISELNDLADQYGVACTIERDGEGVTITMDTGEDEPAATYEDGCHIIGQYAEYLLRRP